MKPLYTLLLALVTIVLSAPAGASPQPPKQLKLSAAASGGKVTFLATGRPSMLKIHGTASSGAAANFELEGAQLRGRADFSLETLDTGIALRTQHMKEKYLHVKEHPNATLKLTDAPVGTAFAQSLSSEGEKPFRGRLLLHGKEADVNGTFSARDGLVTAKFPLKLSDFSIDVPTYLGITVADSVDVTVELPLRKQ